MSLNISFARRRTQRGMSMVELMVGVALGLFIVAGAVTVFVTHLRNSRALLVEARVNQDLRATADLISRDLRRAGYWGNSLAGTVAVGPTSATAVNPYRTVTPNAGASKIEYQFSRDVVEDDTLGSNEQFGFQLNSGIVQMKTDGAPTWQPLTDPNVLTVTALTIVPTETVLDIRESCARTCTGVGCPTLTVRQYLLTLTGRSTTDANVSRTLQTRARVRNDILAGTCPV